MEVVVIDWKSTDSRFVKDELYEHINAPQWVDLAAPVDHVDDDAWFCKPECDHPKTVEDFFKERTPTSKRSASVSQTPPLGERNKRDATLKKRGVTAAQPPLLPLNRDSRSNKIVEDCENQNPNLSTPPNYKSIRFMKEAVKSSAIKKRADDGSLHKEPAPSLRRTLSARNLFGGGEILCKITEFCNELKRLATRGKERENTESSSRFVSMQEDGDCSGDGSREVDGKDKDRTMLLEMDKAKSTVMEKSGFQEKQRRTKRYEGAENIPISIDVSNTKQTEEQQSLLQIRTSPPTPQFFSAKRGPTDATPPKVLRSKPPLERGILQDLVQGNKEEKKDYDPKDSNNNNHVHGKQASVYAEKEARTLDVFWFLKPCTL